MKSDNNVLDYLINSKLCTLENTQVIVSGVVGDLSGISDKDIVSIFGKKGESQSNTKNMYTVVFYVYDNISDQTSFAAAAAVFLFVIILIFTFFQFWVSSKRVHY